MWSNRPGLDAEQRFDELEKQLGLLNLKDVPIETDFPQAGPQEASIHFVDNSGFWLVVLAKGSRYRVLLSSF